MFLFQFNNMYPADFPHYSQKAIAWLQNRRPKAYTSMLLQWWYMLACISAHSCTIAFDDWENSLFFHDRISYHCLSFTEMIVLQTGFYVIYKKIAYDMIYIYSLKVLWIIWYLIFWQSHFVFILEAYFMDLDVFFINHVGGNWNKVALPSI